MRTTEPCDPHGEVLSAIVVAMLSDSAQTAIGAIQARLDEQFPNLFWFPKPQSLHITLFHLISPEVSYERDKDEYIKHLEVQARSAIRRSIPSPVSIPVSLDKLRVFPSAIIAQGEDDGSFVQVRKTFLDNFDLPPLTRKPPDIIHTTVARYRTKYPLAEVEEYVASLDLSVNESVQEFKLVKETAIFLQKFHVLSVYK